MREHIIIRVLKCKKALNTFHYLTEIFEQRILPVTLFDASQISWLAYSVARDKSRDTVLSMRSEIHGKYTQLTSMSRINTLLPFVYKKFFPLGSPFSRVGAPLTVFGKEANICPAEITHCWKISLNLGELIHRIWHPYPNKRNKPFLKDITDVVLDTINLSLFEYEPRTSAHLFENHTWVGG